MFYKSLGGKRNFKIEIDKCNIFNNLGKKKSELLNILTVYKKIIIIRIKKYFFNS